MNGRDAEAATEHLALIKEARSHGCSVRVHLHDVFNDATAEEAVSQTQLQHLAATAGPAFVFTFFLCLSFSMIYIQNMKFICSKH